MAPILRSVNICSFIDGAREQDKQTLITAGDMGLDLGKDFPVVRSGCVLGGLEKSRSHSLLP